MQPWMEEIATRLKSKVKIVKNFNISSDDISKIIKRRKNWSAPGVDGIQNYYWKN